MKRFEWDSLGWAIAGPNCLRGFLDQKDCQVVALCDVYEPYLMRDRNAVDSRIFHSIGDGLVPKMGEQFDGPVARHHDFRRLLEQKDVDAVVIATPDHWHALQTIMAFDAGKDVYVEKPLTATIPEGRKMVQAQERTKRVVQVGLHRRSSKLYAHLQELIRNGRVGKVTVARAYRVSSMFPDGIGKMPDSPPPTGLDWDMWLGPRASQPFRYNIAPYKFRWWSNYSSQMGNWGVHYCDAIRWVFDEEAPSAISAHGGKYAVDDDRTIPDTLDVTFEFASGRVLHFGQYKACDSSPLAGRRARAERDSRQHLSLARRRTGRRSCRAKGSIPAEPAIRHRRRNPGHGRRPHPPAYPEFPRLRALARTLPLRPGDGASVDLIRAPGEPGASAHARGWSGMRNESGLQTTTPPTSCSITSIARLGSWAKAVSRAHPTEPNAGQPTPPRAGRAPLRGGGAGAVPAPGPAAASDPWAIRLPLKFLFEAGWMGVDLFFVLSGFLVSGLIFREYQERGRLDIKRFLIRRGLKIYPGFYTLIGATVGIAVINRWNLPWKRIFSEVFFVQNYHQGPLQPDLVAWRSKSTSTYCCRCC